MFIHLQGEKPEKATKKQRLLKQHEIKSVKLSEAS